MIYHNENENEKKRSHRCDINIEDLSLDIRKKYDKFKKVSQYEDAHIN